MRAAPFVPLLAAVSALLAIGCSSPAPGSRTIHIETPAIEVQPGEDLAGLCFSVPLENESSLWVNAVTMDAGPAWHHSNWLFVPETMFSGPDGVWNCNDRDYDEVVAGIAGGVLFAQSTQVQHEEQSFPPGAAYEIPPRSKVIGGLHLVNAADQPVATTLSLAVHALPERDVSTPLNPMSMMWRPLDLPPQRRSRVVANCDAGAPLDLALHYVLPHYHSFGRGFTFDAIGGASEVPIYATTETAGDTLGSPLLPPVHTVDSTGFRFSCTFENTTDAPLAWSNEGEMCMFLAYTDSPYRWLGGVFSNPMVTGTDGDGTVVFEGPCTLEGL